MPHIIEEENPQPPAAGALHSRLCPVATVMATGVFVTTFVQLQCLGNLPFYSLLMNRMGLDSVQAIAMNVAIVFCSTAAGGLLVEAGRQFGVSGRLSSLRVLAQNLGASIGVPLGGLLAGQALG